MSHDVYFNKEWDTTEQDLARNIKPRSSTGKVYVALKRIYVTSSPLRIFNELQILQMLQYVTCLSLSSVSRPGTNAGAADPNYRGKPHIAHLITALRHEDQVIAVMPYNRHQDFRVRQLVCEPDEPGALF